MLLTPAGKKELDKIGKKFNVGPGAVDSADYAFQAGCTANVLLITPSHLFCTNSGDSRSVLCKRGQAVELSEDHKPDLPSERARILASGHTVEDGRVDGIIAISRALGDWEYKNPKLAPEKMAVSAYPEITKTALGPDLDFVICACDGIWDCMTSQEACDFVNTGKKKLASYKPAISPNKPGAKKPGLKDTGKEKKNKTERKMEESIENSKFKGLATIIEMMMEQNCPKDLAKSEGLGCDNMTAIIVEFKK
jgi:serine/threonine protein phosphatase PrpC